MNFDAIFSMKREEAKESILPPPGYYILNYQNFEGTVAQQTGSMGVICHFAIQAACPDVDLSMVEDPNALIGKKVQARFWLKDKDGAVLDSSGFAREFLDVLLGEGQWDGFGDGFLAGRGRSVKAEIKHRANPNDPTGRPFLDIGKILPVS